jgi:hypothetical protein
MSFRPSRLSVWSLWITIVIGACGPKIHEFKVEPRRICAGDTVRITFRTRGKPHLVAVRRPGSVTDTTRYLIVAESHGKLVYEPADVVTFSPSSAPSLTFDTDLLGQDSLIAVDTASAEAWPDHVRLTKVTSGSSRAMVVIHAGKEGIVPAGSEGSDAWRGLPVSGPWELHAGFLAGERPGNPTSPPPTHLMLGIGLSCGAGAERP